MLVQSTVHAGAVHGACWCMLVHAGAAKRLGLRKVMKLILEQGSAP